MPDQFWLPGEGRLKRALSLRQRAALYQSPLSVLMLIIAVTSPVLNPELLDDGLFLWGLLLHGVLFALCLMIPWEELPKGSVLAIPILDFIAIGLCRNGAVDILPGLGALATFPVIWLAASGLLPVAGMLVSFLGSYLIALFPHLLSLSTLTGPKIVETLLFPIIMLATFLAIRFVSVKLLLQRRDLSIRDMEVLALVEEGSARERLLAGILDAVDVGVVAVDANGRTLLSNRQQQLFHRAAAPGHDGGELLISGSSGFSPLPPDRRPIRRAVNGESYSDYLVWLGEGESQRVVSTAAMPLTGLSGDFTGSVVVFNDVTDLVKALTSKEDFVSNVTHELSTPLTSILGHLDLVLDCSDSLSPAARESLDVARRNAERLSTLVSDLLCAASASMNLHARPTELSGLVELSVTSARTRAEGAGVNLVSEVPDRLWAIADPFRMGQVVDNLLSNAIKYSPDGGRVVVRAHAGVDTVLLEVEDNGMGMTQPETDLVYGRFFRGRSARESAIPGVGLGLSITKAIVEGHGGTIRCASSPGSGTTFTVTLPTTPAFAN